MIGLGQVVSPDYFLSMYQGYPNPISVAMSEYNSADLEVSVDNGTIDGSNGSYTVTPQRTGKLKISVSSQGKNLGNVEFTVYEVPEPKIDFKGIKSGSTVTKSNLISKGTPRLTTTEMMKLFKGIKYRVNGFDVLVSSKSGNSHISKQCKTLVTGKGREAIESCESGDVVTISNIKYIRFGDSTGKKGKVHEASMTFNIK